MSTDDAHRQKSGGTIDEEHYEWIRQQALDAMTKAERHPIAATNHIQTILDDVGEDYGKIADHAQEAKKHFLQSPAEARYHIRSLISLVDAYQELGGDDPTAAGRKPYKDIYGDLDEYPWNELDVTPLHDNLLFEGEKSDAWMTCENPAEVHQ